MLVIRLLILCTLVIRVFLVVARIGLAPLRIITLLGREVEPLGETPTRDYVEVLPKRAQPSTLVRAPGGYRRAAFGRRRHRGAAGAVPSSTASKPAYWWTP